MPQIPFVARAKGTRYKTVEHTELKNVAGALDKIFTVGGASTKLGTPTDGAFTDGLLPITAATTITDAVDAVNENLQVVDDNITALHNEGGILTKLGTPTDGAFTDGLLPITAATTITDAVDAVNENLQVVDDNITALHNEGGILTKLGTPTDGALSDGLIGLTPGTKVTDAVDEVNEILLDLAPAKPDTLEGVTLINSRSVFQGKLPSGLPAAWYVNNVIAGDTVGNIIHYNNLILSSPNISTGFRYGDSGLLVAAHIDGISITSDVAILDILSNFIENPPGTSPHRPHAQDLTLWDITGSGNATIDGSVVFNNGKGTLRVLDVSWYNGFNKWQKMNADMNIQNLAAGYNAFSLKHILDTNEESALYEIYYDDNIEGLAFSAPPLLTEEIIGSSKYVSGVRYYSTGDSFRVTATGVNVYKNVYDPVKVMGFTYTGLLGEKILNPVGVPTVSDTIILNNIFTVDQVNVYDIDMYLSVTLYHPWKANLTANTSGSNFLINTFTGQSTVLHEYFTDEDYRLVIGPHNTVPSPTGNWNSSAALVNGNALVYGNKLSYPGLDLSNTQPLGNPNYSIGFVGDQIYLRPFTSVGANSGVILTLLGLDFLSLGAVGSNDINIEVKIPGVTGWLDAGEYYNNATFTGIDGDGCKVSQAGYALDLTFGIFSTSAASNTIVVRVTFKNNTASIQEMYVNW